MDQLPIDGEIRKTELFCVDCGGYPIDEGAVFVAVYKVSKGQPVLGGMCELCWLKRLERRGKLVNMSTDRPYQVEVPSLGLYRDRLPRR